MPFTPTHVVAVLPLWPLRQWLPFSALAIGAMVPDLGMFLPIVGYSETHTPLGVFTNCVPAGVVVFFLFELLLRRPLVALLPGWLQGRIEPGSLLPRSPRSEIHLLFYGGVVLAIIIGAFTHQFWDAFTHEGRWGTRLIPALNRVLMVGDFAVPGYKLLQYGSTFVGLPLLATFALRSLMRVHPQVDVESVSLRLKLLIMSVISVIPVLVGVFAFLTESSGYHAVGATVKLSGAIVMILLVLYSCGYHVLRALTHPEQLLEKQSANRST
ncbi:MAG: DUF4184 family protein [Planctomyces sp.]|nr:DUF4184 family protein [Planctomyces sp.]